MSKLLITKYFHMGTHANKLTFSNVDRMESSFLLMGIYCDETNLVSFILAIAQFCKIRYYPHPFCPFIKIEIFYL